MPARQFQLIPDITIGDACRIYGMTPRALRFYGDWGLIEPRRNWLNYRVYDAPAQRRLAWIAQLRRVRLPLPDIREVLVAEEVEGRGRAVAIERLEARRRRLGEELKAVEGVLEAFSSGTEQAGAPRLQSAA